MVEFTPRGLIDSLVSMIAAKLNALAARDMPAGGSAGQVLAKISNNDYATEWVTPADGGGVGGTGFLWQGDFNEGSVYNLGDVVVFSSHLFVLIDVQPDYNPIPDLSVNTPWALLTPNPASVALQQTLADGLEGDELTFSSGSFFWEGGHVKYQNAWQPTTPYRYGDVVFFTAASGTDLWYCTAAVEARVPGNPNGTPQDDTAHWIPFGATRSIPPGGVSGQFLQRQGDGDYATGWVDIPTVTPMVITARVWMGV